MPTSDDQDLILLVSNLNERVASLTTTVAVRDRTIDGLKSTTKIAVIGAVLAAVVAIASVVVGVLVWKVAQEADSAAETAAKAVTAAKVAADDTAAAQVANCQSSNSSREGQTVLWDFVIDLSSADAGPAEAVALAEIRTWIHDLFAPRDCSNLKVVVKTPAPPSVKAILKKLKEAGES